jgi:hypothetical protein
MPEPRRIYRLQIIASYVRGGWLRWPAAWRFPVPLDRTGRTGWHVRCGPFQVEWWVYA